MTTMTGQYILYNALSPLVMPVEHSSIFKTPGPVFTKGLSQGLGLNLRLLSQVSAQNLSLRLSGIHKEFKTGLRLSQGLNFKTGW